MNKKTITIFLTLLILLITNMNVNAEGKNFAGKWGYIDENPGSDGEWTGIIYTNDFIINMTYLDGYAIFYPDYWDPNDDNKSITGVFEYGDIHVTFSGFAYINYSRCFVCNIYFEWYGVYTAIWVYGDRI